MIHEMHDSTGSKRDCCRANGKISIENDTENRNTIDSGSSFKAT